MPSDKVNRQLDDVPFYKVSKPAMELIPRGWYREAVIEKTIRSGGKYKIQCSTWRDKKQVMFIYTACIGPSGRYSVRCFVKVKSKCIEIGGPRVQKEYCDHIGAVNKNNRDSEE